MPCSPHPRKISLDVAHPLVASLGEWIWFGYTQALACLFGALLLGAILATQFWPAPFGLARGDFLFLYAMAGQAVLLILRLEHPREALVIAAFHLLATLMEWFKTSPAIGSWRYPEEGVFFQMYGVPLFAGFLYSAVGSYIARAWRLFDFRFTGYPPRHWTIWLAALAYGNFFTHHFGPDLRWGLIVASALLFGRCRIEFRTGIRTRRMPLLLGLVLVTLFIWFAENLGTYAKAWIYPSQEHGWHMVGLGKISAWYLLMLLSFVLVSLTEQHKLASTES
jgi:uncharacterized membrane protein YoaT (DUF817 family)